MMTEQPIIDTPANWDAASQGYAKSIAPFLMEPFVEAFIDCLDVDDQTRVLEIAAGSGALTESLARRVKSVHATDFSPKMLELLELRMINAGFENTTLEVMDGQALKIDDNSYDRAVCCFGLMLFPERHRGFSELYRVLRPGGKAVVTGWAGLDRFEAFALFMEGIKRAIPDFPQSKTPLPVFSLADPVSFKNQMEDAGFKDVKVEFVAKSLTFDSFDKLWNLLTVGAPPVKILFDKLGDNGKVLIRKAMIEIIQERFGSDPIIMTNQATMGYGEVA